MFEFSHPSMQICLLWIPVVRKLGTKPSVASLIKSFEKKPSPNLNFFFLVDKMFYSPIIMDSRDGSKAPPPTEKGRYNPWAKPLLRHPFIPQVQDKNFTSSEIIFCFIAFSFCNRLSTSFQFIFNKISFCFLLSSEEFSSNSELLSIIDKISLKLHGKLAHISKYVNN